MWNWKLLIVTALLTLCCGTAGFWRGRTERLEERAMKPADAPSPEGRPAAADGEAFVKRLERAETATLPEIYEELKGFPREEDRRARLELLCARWAELDPAGGLVFFREKDDGDARARLLLEWALLDTDAAILALAAEGEGGRELAAETGAALLPEDAEVFWKWFRHWRAPLPERGELSANWKAMARARGAELETIAAELMAKDDPAKREPRVAPEGAALYLLLASVKAEADPAAALAWAERLPETVRNAALWPALLALGREDPLTALDRVKLLKSDLSGVPDELQVYPYAITTGLVTNWAKRDLAAVFRWMKDNPAEGSTVEMEMGHLTGVAMAEGKLSVPEAVRMMKDAGFLELNAMDTPWMNAPPEKLTEAVEFLKSQPADDEASRTMLTGLLADWWQRDASAAARATATLPPETQRWVYTGVMRRTGLGTTGPERVERVLNSIPEEHRARAIGDHLAELRLPRQEWLGHYRGLDFSGVPGMLDELPDSAGRAEAVGALAQKWGMLDPGSALEWIRSQENAELRETATSRAVASWATEDAWAASQQVQQMPAGGERDAAVSGLISAIAEQEPDSAWIWAGSIGDSSKRLNEQMMVLYRWSKHDHAAAARAVEQAEGIPEGERAQLRQSVESMSPRNVRQQ